MGANINSISSVASLDEKYNDVFHAVGKRKITKSDYMQIQASPQ